MSASARSPASSSRATRSTSTFKVKTPSKFGTETVAAIKVKTLLGAMYISLEPEGPGPAQGGLDDPGLAAPGRRTTSCRRSRASPTAPRTSTPTSSAKSLDTLADLTKDTPAAFQGTLRGLSRLSETVASRNDQIGELLGNLDTVSGTLADRDEDIVALMKDSDVLLRALVARREAVHQLLVSTSRLSKELTLLVQQTRADLKPALTNLQGVVNVLLKNQSNLDESLRLMAPFYRVFANTLGSGPWFDTYIANLPLPAEGRWLMKTFAKINPFLVGSSLVVALVVAALVAFWPGSETRSTSPRTSRAPSRSTRARTSRSSASPSARSTRSRPSGTKVRVEITYDAKYKVPADAKAAVISPSIVGDRFVQLTPAYTEGAALADNAKLGVDRTATPLELDEIFGSLNDLNIALGPDGANKADAGGVGPLTRLLDSTARNFGGQGVQFNKTLKNLGALHQDAGRQQGRAVRHARAGRGLHQHPGQERRHRAQVQRLAGRRRRPARRRAPGARRGAEEPEHRHDAGAQLREGEPRLADQQHLRPQPDLQDPGQASRRAGRDPAVRPRRAEQPVPVRQRQAGHPGRARQPRRARATSCRRTRRPCCAPSSAGHRVRPDQAGARPAAAARTTPFAGETGRQAPGDRADRPVPRRTRGGDR